VTVVALGAVRNVEWLYGAGLAALVRVIAPAHRDEEPAVSVRFRINERF
jgi:hypothetical protein